MSLLIIFSDDIFNMSRVRDFFYAITFHFLRFSATISRK